MTAILRKILRNQPGSVVGLACAGSLALAGSASALPTPVSLSVGLGTTDELGQANPAPTAGGQAARDQGVITQLIGMTAPSSTTIGGFTYSRSANAFSPLPSASLAVDLATPFSGMTIVGSEVEIDLAANTSYQYLVAGYGGPNNPDEVWDIAGIAAGSVIDIPLNGTFLGDHQGNGSDTHQISSWTLFNPTTTPVPDGGSTAGMIGLGLTGLALVRRKLN